MSNAKVKKKPAKAVKVNKKPVEAIIAEAGKKSVEALNTAVNEKSASAIIVVGHKNPDTDSVCSAICYARLKSEITGDNYVPKRAGELNAETQYVLERFGTKAPEYIDDVATQVRDIEYRHTVGVNGRISLKKAWSIMNDEKVVTLPITEGNRLEGIITIGGIATSYMEELDSGILANAKTPLSNILETLDGKLVVGDENAVITEGKVLIAAANPDLMEDYIKEHDIVILGNRYESQLCAIEMKAGLLVVCEGAKVSMTIKTLAKEKGCIIISTPHDTYSVARLMNQSMPIEHFMKREGLIKFKTSDMVEDIRSVMAENRNRDFPIENHKGEYCGMISRRNLLNMKRKKIILVDHNEKGQAVDGIEDAEILEVIDHHRLGTLETMSPVYFRNEPLGCTATIIYEMYRESGKKIDKNTASLLCAAIISDTLMYRSPTCTDTDRMAAVELAEIAQLDVKEFAEAMFAAGSNLKNKLPEEIFYQDFKKYSAGTINFGVGQISSLNMDELNEIKKRMIPYMKKTYGEHGLDMIFFMLTDIIHESSQLIYIGNGAEALLKNAFGEEPSDGAFMLSGFVSRKKQLVPAIVTAIQQY